MWDKITVGKFQELYDIISGHNFEHEFERQIRLLSCLEGKPVAYYEDMSIPDLQEECKKVAFLSTNQIPQVKTPSTVSVNGQVFKVVYEFNYLTAGQFIDIMNIAKTPEEHILNLNRMLAAICLPMEGRKVGKYCAIPFDEVADMMLQVPIIQAHSIAVFFYRAWNDYLKAIPACLEKKIKRGKHLTETEIVMLAAASVIDGVG